VAASPSKSANSPIRWRLERALGSAIAIAPMARPDSSRTGHPTALNPRLLSFMLVA
jgi:hypothetical protein